MNGSVGCVDPTENELSGVAARSAGLSIVEDAGPSYDGMSFLQTVRIPIDAFTAANESLSTADLTEVRLYINPAVDAELQVDNLEFVAQR